MAHILELSLSRPITGAKHNGYDAAAESLIRKTRCLQKLSLTPMKRNIDWISLLAKNADKLSAVNSLTISTEVAEVADLPMICEEEPLRAIHGYGATQPGGSAAFFNNNARH